MNRRLTGLFPFFLRGHPHPCRLKGCAVLAHVHPMTPCLPCIASPRMPVPSFTRFASSNGSSSGVAPPADVLTDLTEAEFEQVCEESLDALAEFFEDLGDSSITSDAFDVNFASGVITIQLGGDLGTYVINKQSPNKQIWLSSPTSGPKRYDFLNSRWVYKHDGMNLHDLLTSEISAAFGETIDFTKCAYGKNS